MNRDKAIAYLAKVAIKRAQQAERREADALQHSEFLKAQRKKHRAYKAHRERKAHRKRMPRWTIHEEPATSRYVVRDTRRVGVARFYTRKAARQFISRSGAIYAVAN